MTTTTKIIAEACVPEPSRVKSLPENMVFKVTQADKADLTEAGRLALQRSGSDVLVVGDVRKIQAEIGEKLPEPE